ncbi:MAG: PAS domain S-box protein [Bacteroidales bacterium]|nr:PAS domain S-box protein [Bacteroidales bacterium]MCF8396517.1 PAS domain S-box protein [Melioribacteraceae bacterium]
MKTTIGLKIGFAFFVLLFLFGVIGTNIYYSVNNGMVTLEQIKEEARKQTKVGNLRFRVTQVLMASNDYIITNKKFYKQEYQKLNALLDKEYHDLIQSDLTDKEKQLAYEIKIDIDSIRIYSERIFSITNPRQSGYAWESMEIIDNRFGNAVNAKTTLIFDGVSEKIEEHRSDAEMAKQKIITLVQRAILISLIFSLIIIYLSIVKIARPIKKITKAANLIAKGDYTKRLEIKTHDEIASLADSFNQMSESIQQSQKALEDSKRFTESIIEAEPECVCVISQDGTLQSINPAGLRIIDADTSEQVVGKTVDHLVAPEHLQSFQNLTENVFKGVGGTLQFEIVGMKGRRRWLETNSVPLYNDAGHITGKLAITRDITERKLAEELLLKFRMGIEKSGDAVLLTDPDGTIVYVNPAFENIFGYSKEEAIGKTPRILKSGTLSIEYYKNFWNDILTKKPIIHEIINKTKDGRLLSFESSVNPVINEKDEIVGFLAIERDITKRKQNEQELIKAKEKAEENDRLKSAFLANMSHEIRTPMNSILGFTGLLLEPDLSSKQKEEYIKIVQLSGQRMLNTVNDIVEISKIEAGLVEPNLTQTDVNGRMEELFRFFKPRADKKGIKLSLEMLLPQADKNVKTDQNKLDSILTNLIKNAIKYTDSGDIQMGCLSNGSEVEFYIKDTGIGIPKDRQEAIFERFIQADIADKRAFQGSGLGLAISKSYVEMLGGKIWVESREGKGSTFYFTLPLTKNTKEKPAVSNEIPIDNEKNKVILATRSLKILIAEDDKASRKYISLIVNDFCTETLEAETGIEAVEICRNTKDLDIIMMDIQMPEMNGYEATRRIREFNKEVVIIAQTAFALSGDGEKAIIAGCNDYISKPVNKNELLGLVQKYFGK